MPDSCDRQVPGESQRRVETSSIRADFLQAPATPADIPCKCSGAEPLCSTTLVPRMTCTEDSQQPQTTTIAIGHPDPGERDLECLVCREPYSCARPPKLLSCQHAFCAVCLKLLLCVQADTWSISCPLCRKLTTVPGGLICSLRSQEEVVRWLAQPRPEVQLCPQGLVGAITSSTAALPSSVGEDGLGTMSANRVAARRLAAHLLLLVLLIFLILPFIYPGVIRWVLALIIGLALLMAVIFCCYPYGLSSSHRILLCGELKHSEIASIA